MQWLQLEHAWIYIVIARVLVYALGVRGASRSSGRCS
jgi:hypothetical protein